MELKNTNLKVYSFAGKARSGKTTAGDILKKEYENKGKKVAVMQIAHYIKDYAKQYFGWDGKEETKPRDLLLQLGDLIRVKMNQPYFFIDRITQDIEVLSHFYDVLIIDDVRITIEIDTLRERLNNHIIFIKLERDLKYSNLNEKQKQHLTEIGLDNYNNYEYIINNDGSINELKENIIKIINQEELK